MILWMGFWSCGKENLAYQSKLSIIQAIPAAQTVFLEVGGARVADGLRFGDFRTIEVPAITGTVGWGRTGWPPDVQFTTDLPNGSYHTVAFFDSAPQYKVLFVPERWQQPNLPDQAWLRFIPLLITGDPMFLVNDTNRMISSQRRFADFMTNPQTIDFLRADTGATSIKLILAGSQPMLLDSLPNIRLQAGKSYTVYALGNMQQPQLYPPVLIWQTHP